MMRQGGTTSALLLAFAVGTSAAIAAGPTAPAMDAAAPALVLTTLDGAAFDLAKLRGKVVLVNYWATWCAPCIKEMPTFDAFYRRYHARGLEMVAISTDFPRDLPKVRKTAKTLGYPVAVTGAITDDGFGAPDGVPITYVIDADGIVRDRFIAVPNKLLRDVVVPLLAHATGDAK